MKSIQTGIEKLIQHNNKRQTEQSDLQWRDLRNKMDSLLLRTNVLKTDEARKACLALDTMPPEERVEYIRSKWGPQYVQKVEPLLYQLAILEKHIATAKPNET
jgi:hypothetical protein